MNTALEEAHPNDPTVAFLPTLDASPTQPTQPASWQTGLPTIPATPVPGWQQNFNTRPDGTGYDATQLASGPGYQINSTPQPPVTQPGVGISHPSYPGYVPTSGANYPPQGGQIPYPGFPVQQPQSSPGFIPPAGAAYQPIADSFGAGQQAPQKRSKGGFIVLLVLLFIIGGVAGAFVLKQPAILFNKGTATGTATQTVTSNATQTGNGTGTGTGTAAATTPTVVPTPSPTPSPIVPITQQAQTLIQQYYNDINNKDYSTAYAQLGSQMQQQQQSYAQYKAGYANTQQDVITITNTAQQADGTVRVDLILQATHTDGTQQTYQGYYIVGIENGALKILSGQFQQTA